jgi:hypothetical protein
MRAVSSDSLAFCWFHLEIAFRIHFFFALIHVTSVEIVDYTHFVPLSADNPSSSLILLRFDFP